MDYEHIEGGKKIIALFTAVFLYLFDCISPVVVVLVILMAIDYATGIAKGAYQRKLSTAVALHGLMKKLGYIILFMLGFLLDYLLIMLLAELQIAFPLSGLVGLLVMVWLIGVEGLSILENLDAIDIQFPPVIKKLFTLLKKESEKRGNINENL